MSSRRLPFRDPRTVARDIPGVLDILFPRLSGGLVASMNRKMFRFSDIEAIPDARVEESTLQKSMLFELSVARAERILGGNPDPDWQGCLKTATERQRRHFDARIPETLSDCDIDIAGWAAQNLVQMLRAIMAQHSETQLICRPNMPGMGWVSSGSGDFSLGHFLIEVKHTDRNFVSGDFRQVLIYWILKYAASLEGHEDVWSHCLLLNPRRNACLAIDFDYLLRSASANLNRIEIYELMRSVAARKLELIP